MESLTEFGLSEQESRVYSNLLEHEELNNLTL